MNNSNLHIPSFVSLSLPDFERILQPPVVDTTANTMASITAVASVAPEAVQTATLERADSTLNVWIDAHGQLQFALRSRLNATLLSGGPWAIADSLDDAIAALRDQLVDERAYRIESVEQGVVLRLFDRHDRLLGQSKPLADEAVARATIRLVAGQVRRAPTVRAEPGKPNRHTNVITFASKRLYQVITQAPKRFAFTSVLAAAVCLALLPQSTFSTRTEPQTAAAAVSDSSGEEDTGTSQETQLAALNSAASHAQERNDTLAGKHQSIAEFLAKRYQIARERSQHYVQLAVQTGAELNLDPWLILAVMSVESGLNPKAVSNVGAQGLMQVHTPVHAKRFAAHGGVAAAFDPRANIRVGAGILREYIDRHGSVKRALKAYVGAALLAEDGGYSAKVMIEHERLAAVAAGRTFKEPPQAARISQALGRPLSQVLFAVNATELGIKMPRLELPIAALADTAVQLPAASEQQMVQRATDSIVPVGDSDHAFLPATN